MARDLSKAKLRFINALKGIYSTSVYGANASTMTVNELQNVVQSLFADYNSGQAAWADLVGLMGATEARALLAQTVDNPSADVSAQLAQVSTDLLAVLTAYQNAFGTGTNNRTFSYAVNAGQLTGGFTDIDISGGTLTAVNNLCSTLQTSVEAITPVS